MSFESWLLFCVTEAVLCLSPGPSVLMILSLSLTRGSSAGLRASCGVLAANASYFALSATGLGAILATSVTLFWLIKWLGAAYLLWVGARMVVGALRGRRRQTITADVSGAAEANSFRRGFVTQASNPNLLVYFTAILPQFLDTQASLPGQIALLGISSIIIELLVLSAYSTAVGFAGRMVWHPRFERVVRGFGGLLLIGAGIRLAATDQS